jgi:glycosyltransferase involved in cell wall biosynthesis
MSKRVLFVHEGYLYRDRKGNLYGAQYNDRLIERYELLGDCTTFILREKFISDDQKDNLDQITKKNFEFIPIPNFKSISSYRKHIKEVKKIIHENIAKSDVIVARMPSQTAGIAIKEAKRLNKPLLVEVVACTFDAYWNHSWKGKLIAHYRYFRVRKIIRNCEFVIYVTQEFLQSRYPTKGTSVALSDVELKPYDDRILIERKKKIENHLTSEPLVIGTVAALAVSYKRQVDVIKSIAKLKKIGIVFKYKLVGEGNPQKLIQTIKIEGVEELVSVIGTLKHDEVFEFLKSIDLYIQPSKQEGLPRSLVEAMSMAVPSFGSKIAGIPELLDSDCLFEAGNIDEICKKLMSVNQDFLLDQAKINFERAKHFQITDLIEKRRNFYNLFLLKTNVV